MDRDARSNQREFVRPVGSDWRSRYTSLRTRLLATVAVVLAAVAGPATRSRGEGVNFEVERLPEGIRATLGGKPVLEYRSIDAAHKPYVSKLYTPSGRQLLRDSPSDHLHHHGLMFALGVNSVNFWEEKPGAPGLTSIGRQRGGEVRWLPASEKQGAQTLTLSQALDWLDGEGRALLQERRELTVRHERDARVLWLSWNSRLASTAGQRAVLTGQRYFGLGVRFVQAMDQGGKFLFADDRSADPAPRHENLIRASWCAYVADMGAGPVTVAMFSDPANRRHPTRWFTMVEPFAYLSATLGLDERPLEMPAKESLDLSYGIALSDGVMERDEINRQYQAWLRQD